MKHLIITLLLPLCLIGCSPTKKYYFYATIDSPDKNMSKDHSGIFIEEKDSIKVSYAFSGENITMNLHVENKLPYPISINWDKSHLQLNDMMPKIYNNIHRKGHELDTSPITKETGRKYTLLKDAAYNFRQINKRKAKRKEKTITNRNVKTRSLEFDSDNSPLFFTSTLYFDTDKKESTYTNSFYLSSLNRVDKKSYKKIKKRESLRGDIFCIVYEKERNNKLGGLLLAGFIETALFIMDTKLNEGIDEG